MTQQRPLPDAPGASSFLQRIGFRRLSIAIMLVGAGGFIAALLIYDGAVGCLSLSTLVTMGGLALLITARRRGWEPAPQSMSSTEPTFRRRGKVPPALRGASAKARSRQEPLSQRESAGERESWTRIETFHPIPRPAQVEQSPAGVEPGSLADQVINVLEGQNSRVMVEQSMERRAILRILLAGGVEYLALVIEGEPAGTAEARALLALVTRFQSGRGYLISEYGFLPETYDWAAGRVKIRLVSGDELDELGV